MAVAESQIRTVARWLAEPANFFAAWMGAFLALSWWRFGGEMSSRATLFVLACAGAALGGLAISTRVGAGREEGTPEEELDLDRVERWFLPLLAIWAVVLAYHSAGLLGSFDLSDPTATKNLATETFVEREGDLGAGSPALDGLMLVLYVAGFPSLVLGAILAASGRPRGFLPLALGAAGSLLSFSRFHLFVYLVLFTYCYLMRKTDFLRDVGRAPRVLAILGVLAGLAFAGPALLRAEGEAGLVDIVTTYLFGGLAAFSQWLGETSLTVFGDGAGRSYYSLATWLARLGLGAPPPPLHLEFTAIGDSVTNVYSAFRLLADDFGWALPPVLALGFGLASGVVTRRAIDGARWRLVPLVAFAWALAFFSFYTVILADFRIFLGCAFSWYVLGKIVEDATPPRPEGATAGRTPGPERPE